MRFVCESCRAQYMINDEKVGPKGVKVRCRKCGYVITVKRTEPAKAATPQVTAPLPMSNDPDDSTATQVMQTPVGDPTEHEAHDSADSEVTHPAANLMLANASSPSAPVESRKSGPSDSFLGADEDEIGAVFDQVLRTGPTVVTKEALEPPPSSDLPFDDRDSTRVIDAQTVAQLARESGNEEIKTAEKKVDVVPETNWFVAINEKQTGPLTLDKVKEHWDHGEVGPDSLCWREGFPDWIPLSDVKALASVLAPKPPKPIVVPTAVIPAAPSVVSVPVQSAFSAGGVVQTVQSEMQVPIAAASSSIADREESGTWRPSAASALASLVKDEMDALARPPAKPVVAPVEEVSTRGLLDVPDDRPVPAAPVAAPRAEPARAPANPYLANPGATYSAPAVSQYRPPSNRNLIVGVAVGGGLLIAVLIGIIVWVVNRQPVYPVAAQPPVVPTQPVQATAPAAQPTPVAVAPSAAQPAPVQPSVAQPPPQPAAQPAVAQAAVAQPPVAQPPSAPLPTKSASRRERATKAEAPPPPEPREAPRKADKAEPDDFESAFGTGKPARKEEVKAEPTRKRDVVIPPAPGAAGDVKESLGAGDIMEVVSNNKAALLKCAEEQRKREPGVSGKLVMKWTVQTSGRVTNVGVVTEEFRGTYMAGCVGGMVKGWVFPRHKVQGDPVQFPFKF